MLKLRATIIGYVPPLVVYGSLKPLLGESVKLFGIIGVSHDPPLKRELRTRQCEWLFIGMTPSHN